MKTWTHILPVTDIELETLSQAARRLSSLAGVLQDDDLHAIASTVAEIAHQRPYLTDSKTISLTTKEPA